MVPETCGVIFTCVPEVAVAGALTPVASQPDFVTVMVFRTVLALPNESFTSTLTV